MTENSLLSSRTNRTAAVARAGRPSTAESIRLDLAEAWGEMGASWGVTPAIARVQAYLMARQEPLTEREVREALGLSHRAASLALAEAESWGLVQRVPEPRRVGRRGPAGTAFLAVTDHWQWFGRVIAERKSPRGRPDRRRARGQGQGGGRCLDGRTPTTPSSQALAEWLSSFVVFVRLFDRAVGIVPQLEPRELERALQLLDRVPEATVLRLFDLLGGLDDDDVLELVDAVSRLSPSRGAPGDEADVGRRSDGLALAGAGRGERTAGRSTARPWLRHPALHQGRPAVVVGGGTPRAGRDLLARDRGRRRRAASDPDLGRVGRRALVCRGRADPLAAQPAREPADGDPRRGDRQRGRDRRRDRRSNTSLRPADLAERHPRAATQNTGPATRRRPTTGRRAACGSSDPSRPSRGRRSRRT